MRNKKEQSAKHVSDNAPHLHARESHLLARFAGYSCDLLWIRFYGHEQPILLRLIDNLYLASNEEDIAISIKFHFSWECGKLLFRCDYRKKEHMYAIKLNTYGASVTAISL